MLKNTIPRGLLQLNNVGSDRESVVVDNASFNLTDFQLQHINNRIPRKRGFEYICHDFVTLGYGTTSPGRKAGPLILAYVVLGRVEAVKIGRAKLLEVLSNYTK